MFAPLLKIACLTTKNQTGKKEWTTGKKQHQKMLIFQAIVEAPNQQLNLCDIYAWFQANFLHFRSSNLTWKVKIKNIHTQTDRQTEIIQNWNMEKSRIFLLSNFFCQQTAILFRVRFVFLHFSSLSQNWFLNKEIFPHKPRLITLKNRIFKWNSLNSIKLPMALSKSRKILFNS